MRHLVGKTRMAINTGLVALALAGCSHNQADTGIIPDQSTILRVDNQSFNDMRIYVIQGGQRIRVGTANGKNTSTFKVPRSIISGFTTVRVEAVPIGANGHSVSEEISVQPGEELELRILP
jgi:outer membrane lipoprotein SlyB